MMKVGGGEVVVVVVGTGRGIQPGTLLLSGCGKGKSGCGVFGANKTCTK
jgi:hypothetical protein